MTLRSCRSCFIIGLETSSYPLSFIEQGRRISLQSNHCSSLGVCTVLLFQDPFAIAVFCGFVSLHTGAHVTANDFSSMQANTKTPTVSVEIPSDKCAKCAVTLHLKLLIGPKDSDPTALASEFHDPTSDEGFDLPSFPRAAHSTIMMLGI